jgi:hypothetical protein
MSSYKERALVVKKKLDEKTQINECKDDVKEKIFLSALNLFLDYPFEKIILPVNNYQYLLKKYELDEILKLQPILFNRSNWKPIYVKFEYIENQEK